MTKCSGAPDLASCESFHIIQRFPITLLRMIELWQLTFVRDLSNFICTAADNLQEKTFTEFFYIYFKQWYKTYASRLYPVVEHI